VTPRVVITGASSGIGRALAAEYARRGAMLGLIARRAEMLRELAAGLKVQTALYPLDVGMRRGWRGQPRIFAPGSAAPMWSSPMPA
jgi:short-subunit dehydrogenase